MTQPTTPPPPYQPPPSQQVPQHLPPPPSSPPPSAPPAGGPPPAPAQQHQPGPPAADPNAGYLVLTLQGNVMTSSMIPPKVRLNGYPVATSYGQNVLPVPPGRWHLDVSCQWLKEFGQAAIDVDVAPGQHVPIFYAAPMHQFTTGSIGFEKQPRKGVAVFALIIAVALALVSLSIVLAVL
ncbi:hypothetical protein [Nocardioides sp. cx-173]|uniref:hypothetical protein n=1 Tax=Nocardioides sp. cx-173 TaxID=2898796 RepID=UPI001E32841B|nr:hypothetical protein [Nocardioides sp. cx-173]MCD4525620.1 hypothetical protein [Nocardioides sp. cx-173]UGB42761.1 hypothetical protein LQ940_04360 [Nocardioides sp. cx-173]